MRVIDDAIGGRSLCFEASDIHTARCCGAADAASDEAHAAGQSHFITCRHDIEQLHRGTIETVPYTCAFLDANPRHQISSLAQVHPNSHPACAPAAPPVYCQHQHQDSTGANARLRAGYRHDGKLAASLFFSTPVPGSCQIGQPRSWPSPHLCANAGAVGDATTRNRYKLRATRQTLDAPSGS